MGKKDLDIIFQACKELARYAHEPETDETTVNLCKLYDRKSGRIETLKYLMEKADE